VMNYGDNHLASQKHTPPHCDFWSGDTTLSAWSS
jgi:hypothetical protein